MHCRFAKDILIYIPHVESHVLRHGKLQQEDLDTNWLTGLEMQTSLHPVQSKLKSITYHSDP